MTTPIRKPDDMSQSSMKMEGIEKNLMGDDKASHKKAAQKAESAAANQQLKKGTTETQFDTVRTSIPPSGADHAVKAGEKLAKGAVEVNYTEMDLVGEIFNPNFGTNNRRFELLGLIKKRIASDKDPAETKLNWVKIIIGGQPNIETIFQSLEAIIEKNEFPNILSKLPDELLSKKFCNLLFDAPGQALNFITNFDPKFFSSASFVHVFRYCSFSIDSRQDKEFAACLEYILKNNSDIGQHLDALALTVVRLDLPLTFKVLITSYTCRSFYLKALFFWDSANCLKQLQIQNSDRDSFYSLAVESQAQNCLALLVEKIGLSAAEQQNYEKKILGWCDLSTLISLYGNNANQAALTAFSSLIPLLRNPAPYLKKIEQELENILKPFLRFNSINVVDRIVDGFMAQNSAAADIFPGVYQKVKNEFLEIAPFISRYKKPIQVKDLRMVYTQNIIENPLTEELSYAKFCREQVEQLKQKLNDEPAIQPTTKEFAQLPPSTKGTRRAAAIVESIGLKRSETQGKRQGLTERTKSGKLVHLQFKTLRTNKCRTPISSVRYMCGHPLVNCVEHMSNAPDITRSVIDIHDEDIKTYNLIHKGKVVCNVTRQKESITGFEWWHHGQIPVDKTWQDIEDVFEKLMDFNFQKPSENDRQAQKNYEKQLDEFYADAAELVWLIGTTTPLERGSGTVAEWMLGLVFLQNGLELPVLKTEFPQLDVLDLTFPLSDYKDFFTYFFEPSTLPEHIKWPDLSHLPPHSQLKTLYAAKEAGQLQKMHAG